MQDRTPFGEIDPIKDRSRLQTTLEVADSVLVVAEFTYDPKNRKNNKVLARSRDTQLVASAVEAVDPDLSSERMHWMTPGNTTLVFLQGRDLLAMFHCINPTWVRSELWNGWARLQDGDALIDVLVTLASQAVAERLAAGHAPDSIAKGVRYGFDLTSDRVAEALVQGGLSIDQASAATACG